MWDEARIPFLHVLDQLKPNVILVLGKELAVNLPVLPDNIESCHIQHPATAFDYRKWNPLFAEAVQRAQVRRENTRPPYG